MKLGEAMYERKPGGETRRRPTAAPTDGAGAKNDDVVDADFEEVDDDKKNKKSA